MKRFFTLLFFLCISLVSCGNSTESTSEGTENPSETVQEQESEENVTEPEKSTEAETQHATAPQQEVGFEGMTEISADSLKEGEYHISVDSSSSMFKIADCILKVDHNRMTADIVINSKSYDFLYMGTAERAESAESTDLIGYTENSEGQSVFTVPVEALDKEVQCSALSAKKQEWYDRVLVFRADSLPDSAFAESRYTTAESLGLADGEYTAEVTLEGGSGKASVNSPAKITVRDGKATAEIVWSSNNYDYMIVDGEKYLPVTTDQYSVFEIPVVSFDFKVPVSADTTAMSVPHEIDYTLYFDSSTLLQ